MEYGKWTSVDTLPEKDGKYIVVRKGISYGHYFIDILGYSSNLRSVDNYDFWDAKKGEGGFYDYDHEWGYCKIDDITHWMPIPELPNEKEMVD